MSRNSTDLELVHDGNQEQLVGVRFQNVTLPAGATINSAYVQFTVDETDSGSTNVVIAGHDTGDAAVFSTSSNDISNRSLTSQTVLWSIPAWNSVGASGADQRTPDLTAVINEITGRGDWSSGNAMAFVITAGSGCNGSACQRTAESYNGSTGSAPVLVIDYTIADSVDLVVTQIDSPDPVYVSANYAYTVTITNNGSLDASGVLLTDSIPINATLRSVTSSQGTCDAAYPVVCIIGDLLSSAAVQVVFIVTANVSGTLTNTATASANEVDATPSNNTNDESTTVTGNTQQLCYLVADSGGGNGGDDQLTIIDTADFNPATNEADIGSGTGTSLIEAIAWNSSTQILYAANANQLGTLSLLTGVFTPLPSTFGTGSNGSGSNVTFSDVDAMSYDRTSGVLYGVHAQAGSDVLFQINMATGAHISNAFGAGVDYVTVQAILGNDITDDIAIDPNTGIMYATVNSGGNSDRLVVVDKFTGATTDVAAITVPDIEGLGTDPSGQLWGTSGTQNFIYEIDKNTGIGSFGRAIDNGSDYESVDCYAISPSITADIAVVKTVDVATPAELSDVQYMVSVTNNGTGPANALQINDSLPAGVTLVGSVVSQGLYDVATGNWFVGNLANGTSATLVLNASVDAGTSGSVITNTATVTFVSQTDPNSANDNDSVDITVLGIELQKTVNVETSPVPSLNPKAIPGSTMLYRITVTNTSAVSTDIDTIEIIDQLPDEVALFVNQPSGAVEFTDGSPTSGLTYTFVSYASNVDDIDFSNDTDFTDGITWGYIPSTLQPTDAAITAIRIRPSGVLNPAAGGNPSFVLEYRVLLD